MKRKKGIVTRFLESDFNMGFWFGIAVLEFILAGFGII